MKKELRQVGVFFARFGARRMCCGLVTATLLVCAFAVDGQAQTAPSPDDPESRPVASNLAVSLDGGEPATPPVDESKAALEELPQVDAAATARQVPRRGGPGVVPPRDSPDSVPWYRTGIGALAIVLAGIGGVYLLVRRCLPAGRLAGTDAIHVAGRTALTPKHSLALVQLGRRFVLVGVSGDRLENLCEVSDPAEVAELAARTGSRLQPGALPFDDTLLKEAAAFTGPGTGTGDRKDCGLEKTAPQRDDGRASSSSSVSELLRRLRVLQSR